MAHEEPLTAQDRKDLLAVLYWVEIALDTFIRHAHTAENMPPEFGTILRNAAEVLVESPYLERTTELVEAGTRVCDLLAHTVPQLRHERKLIDDAHCDDFDTVMTNGMRAVLSQTRQCTWVGDLQPVHVEFLRLMATITEGTIDPLGMGKHAHAAALRVLELLSLKESK